MDIKYKNQLIKQIKIELGKKQTDFLDTNNMIERQRFLEYSQWTNKPYTRICLFENKDFELILICWNPMAQTSIHDHDNQNCTVFFFDGSFEETLYCSKGINTLKTRKVKSGSITSMGEGNLCHSLKNISQRKAMTLHLYNEPIKNCRVRNKGKERLMENTMLEYDVVV